MPVGQFMGRQPEKIIINPSRSYPWYGNWVGNDTLTTQQRLYLDQRRMPQDTERMTVYRQATSQELYWPTTAGPPVFEFECPIIGKRGDRVKVLSPGGEVKLVFADGWVSRPHRLNRRYIESRTAADE